MNVHIQYVSKPGCIREYAEVVHPGVQAVQLSPVYAQLVVCTDIYYVHTAYFWIRLYSGSAGSGSD